MKKDIRNKTALVTGASSGLGVDFARELAKEGANLILVARREERLKAVQAEIKQEFGVDVDVIPMDLTQPDAPQALYDRLKSGKKPVDVLVNNAGYGLFGMFTELPWEKQKQMLDLDVIALTHLTKLFVPDMVERKFGAVLQVASIAAYQPAPTYASYAGAKSYVLFFSEALDHELRGTGVNVTTVSPGVTATEFLKVGRAAANPLPTLGDDAKSEGGPPGDSGFTAPKAQRGAGIFQRLQCVSDAFYPTADDDGAQQRDDDNEVACGLID